MKVIDIRSDTVTVPTDEMRRVMMAAEVGDDVFGEDPSVNALEAYCRELFDKPAALFVPSGTMGNQICLKINTQEGDEVICEQNAHIYYYETAAPSILSRIQLRPLPSDKGEIPLENIKAAIRPDIYYFPKTRLICLENTHNRHGGSILSLEYIKEVSDFAEESGLRMHCDGARLWNACAATGIEPKEYAKYFDTVNVCFSKALGAPVGSLILGTEEAIEKGRKWRKILGGGMRQAGILASACSYALLNNFPLLRFDHDNAREFAKQLVKTEFVKLDLNRIESNMVMFDIDSRINTDDFVNECRKEGVVIIPFGAKTIRAVFHFQISREEAVQAADLITDVLQKLAKV